jgi:hypothetical protein
MALNMNDGTNPPDKDLSEYAEVIEMAREAGEKIARYEAGQDATPREEGIVLSPAQLWHKLLTVPEDQRLAMLRVLTENARTAYDCFAQDHGGALMQLEADREALSHAVFGSPTLDSTSQLHTAVRALRSVMVDGIAARGGVVEYREVEPETFPEEPDVREKIGAQLKSAGIDLSSVCGYQWEGPATDACDGGAHACRLVNPLHVQAHECDPDHCGQTLTHIEAEQLAEAGK